MCPHVLLFDSKNKTHLDFIVSYYDFLKIVDQHEIVEQLNQISSIELQAKANVVNSDDTQVCFRIDECQDNNIEYKIENVLSRMPKSDE